MPSEPTDRQSPSRARLWWPVIACLLMIAWSNIPPYRSHIKGEKRSLLVWHWKLYQQGGLKYCDIRYFDMKKGGEPIERWTLLGYDRPGAMPDNILRVQHKGLFSDYNRVCQAMRKAGDPEPEVEAYARCGVDKGWKEVERRKRNICEIKNQKGRNRKGTKVKAQAQPVADEQDD